MGRQTYWPPQISFHHHMKDSVEGYALLACSLGEVCSSDTQQRPLKTKQYYNKSSHVIYQFNRCRKISDPPVIKLAYMKSWQYYNINSTIIFCLCYLIYLQYYNVIFNITGIVLWKCVTRE